MSISDMEITSLRDELAQNSDQIIQLVQFSVMATAAVLGLGLSKDSQVPGYIALVPLLILSPAFSLVMNRRSNIIRIATYLQVFARGEFQYECRFCKFKKTNEKLNVFDYQTSLELIFILIGLVCIILSFNFFSQHHASKVVPAIATVVWGIVSTVQLWRARQFDTAMGLEKKMLDHWLKVHDDSLTL